jgi:hypothetical protein
MSKFLLNLLLQISKALVYSKIKFYSEKNFPSLSAQPAQRLASLSAHAAHPAASSSSLRRPSATSSSSRAAAPWTPPPPSASWSYNGRPPITPPLQSVVVTSPLHSGNGSHEGANYRRRPPFPAALPPSRPYKRVPALWWSTSPLHLASSPPQSCLH